MTSRRTLRSGASFGSPEELHKPKQSVVRRQQTKEDRIDTPEQHATFDDGEESKGYSGSMETEKSGESGALQFDDDKENMPGDSLSITSCTSSVLPNLCDPVAEPALSGASTVRTGVGEKSDILVSLLGGKHIGGGDWGKNGNAGASSAARTTCDGTKTSADDRDVSSRHGKDGQSQSVVRTRKLNADVLSARECSTTVPRPDVCFFSNGDHQSRSSSANMLKMSEIPGEAFLVSLSNDETKELNMVKTTSGTMRVGSGLHKFMPQSYSFQEPFSKHASQGGGKSKGQGDKWCSNVGKCRNDGFDAGFSNLDNCLLSHSDKVDRHNKRSSVEERASRTPPPCSESFVGGSAKSGGNIFDNVSAYRNTCDLMPPTLVDCLSSKPIADKLGPTHGDFIPTDKDASSNIQRVSQYPLMEGILTHQSYESSIPRDGHDRLDPPESGDGIARPPRKAISLLKAPSTPATPSSPMLDSDCRFDSCTIIKRSARLRCRTEAKPACTVVTQQPVISTMKPASSFKSKPTTPSTGAKKKKTHTSGTSAKGNKKKKVKKRGDNKKGGRGKSKDVARPKHVMSREVMDGIVQSIEETVSRVSQEQSQLSPEGGTSNSVSGISDEVGQQDCLSGMEPPTESFLPHANSESRFGDSAGTCLVDVSSKEPCKIINKSKTTKKSKTKHSATKKFQKSTKSSSKGSSLHSSKFSKAKKSKSKELELPELVELSTPDDCQQSEGGERFVSSAETRPTQSKRFRKKTRKAEEALGNDDVFCDDDYPTKKSKAKKRCIGSSFERGYSGPRRSRRSSQQGGLVADPVLGEHAFILWASEHRSEVEQQHPEASTSQLDAILSSRWAQVADNAKARFFLRARDAFSDEDRLVRSSRRLKLTQEDPVYIEFIRLSEDRQRELLRKWLKFFQKMMPRTEYAEFIVGFKRACGREGSSLGEGRIRTRLRRLDPAHYRTLFDMIRITKPRVVEMYRENRGRERKVISDTYSLMLRQLVNGKPWPHLHTDCRSAVLTQLLEDLQVLPPLCSVAGFCLNFTLF
ncbi:uncharacterized protein LOC101851413 [Aplysia californica]|uniref:Uncharacterized protein LOC101851413 n=1 Tax=Aplysia californica TaxID=6500 RepID=A0ABM1A192_APLCA|nr:uncharacterized protein LOC101851413 [Aplysia californica]